MTDTQILTIALAVIFPALGVIGAITASIHANKRIDESIGAVNKRIDESTGAVNKRLDAFEKHVKEHIDNGFEHMKLLLELHEAKHHK